MGSRGNSLSIAILPEPGNLAASVSQLLDDNQLSGDISDARAVLVDTLVRLRLSDRFIDGELGNGNNCFEITDALVADTVSRLDSNWAECAPQW